MRALCVITFACLLAAGAFSTSLVAATKAAPISVAVTGLNCTTPSGQDTFSAESWSWGADATFDPVGGGQGKSTLSTLTMTRLTDACSPALFGAVMTGTHYRNLTLTQLDASGVVTSTMQMEDVVVTSFKLGGTALVAAQETLQFTAGGRFSFTDAATGARFCWDVARNLRC